MNKRYELRTTGLNNLVRDTATTLGYASMIMLKCRRSSNFHLRTLSFWIMPAIDHQQVQVFFDRNSTPVGFVIWAHLAADSEERLLNDPNFLLHPCEWNEGGRTWIIDFCFPNGGALEALGGLKSVFREAGIGQVFWARRNDDYSVKRIRQRTL